MVRALPRHRVTGPPDSTQQETEQLRPIVSLSPNPEAEARKHEPTDKENRQTNEDCSRSAENKQWRVLGDLPYSNQNTCHYVRRDCHQPPSHRCEVANANALLTGRAIQEIKTGNDRCERQVPEQNQKPGAGGRAAIGDAELPIESERSGPARGTVLAATLVTTGVAMVPANAPQVLAERVTALVLAPEELALRSAARRRSTRH